MKLRSLFGLALVALVAACGGGGGGSSNGGSSGGTGSNGGNNNPAGDWLSLTPKTVEVTTYEAMPISFKVTGKSSRVFSAPFNLGIVDPNGVLTTAFSVKAYSEMEYEVTLNTNPALPAGVHKTNVAVRVCEDHPVTCARPFPGSPWTLPVQVTVKSKAERDARIQLSPATIELTTQYAESQEFFVDANVAAELGGQDLTWRIASHGLIDSPYNNHTPLTTGSKRFTLRTQKMLPVGTHPANVELYVCKWASGGCNQLPGSPWLVPIKITVKNTDQLKPLEVNPLVPAWSGVRGNPGHTAYVPGRYDASKFTRRWLTGEEKDRTYREALIAVDNGVVVETYHKELYPFMAEAVAYSEQDGSVLWRKRFKEGQFDIHRNYLSTPAISGANVYFAFMTKGNVLGTLWVHDVQTGREVGKHSFNPTDFFEVSDPTVVGSQVYLRTSTVPEMTRYDSTASRTVWKTEIPGEWSWTPAIDGNVAYTFGKGKLYALDVNDGKVQYSLLDDGAIPYPNSMTPVVPPGQQLAFAFNGGRLVAFDLANQSRAWAVKAPYWETAAFGNGVLYAVQGNVVEARTARTGTLQWSAKLDGEVATKGHLLVTDNLLFVSKNDKTYAIDLGTQKIVWSYPVFGKLAISNRNILYIASGYGRIEAINLR